MWAHWEFGCGCVRDDLLERSTARAKKRQKVYRHAQFMPLPSQIPAESLHGSKVSVGYAPKNGKNFTRMRAEGTDRKCGAGRSGRNFTAV